MKCRYPVGKLTRGSAVKKADYRHRRALRSHRMGQPNYSTDKSKKILPLPHPPLPSDLTLATADPLALRAVGQMVEWRDMQTLVIDTNGIVKKLEQRGFSRTQAEGITEALKELDVSTLSTKADLKDLELRLYKYLGGILIAHGLGTAALTVALLQLLN